MIKKAPLNRLLLQRGLWLAAMVSSFAIGSAVGHAQGLSDVALPPVTRDATRELATKITQPFVFAAVGDVWATTRPNAPLDDPRLQSLFGIMRSAVDDAVNGLAAERRVALALARFVRQAAGPRDEVLGTSDMVVIPVQASAGTCAPTREPL